MKMSENDLRDFIRQNLPDDQLVNPMRAMHSAGHWNDADPIIAATMDVIDAINDVQRAHNACCECGPMWRVDEALRRRRQAIRRLAAINEQCEQNDSGF